MQDAETHLWQTIGGAVEPDEAPLDAVIREAADEAAVSLWISGIRGVTGGPRFRVTYPNGDLVSYVTIVFDAEVIEGRPRPDGVETIAAQWSSLEQLAAALLSSFTSELLAAVGVPTAR